MKTNLFLLTMLAGTLPLASCDKNNPADELPGPQPPAVSTQAEAALKAKYPAATNVVWQTKQGYVVAHDRDGYSFRGASRSRADGL
ncbi:hypothetical protein [Alistipes putredinis]|uniref:hypothetical protein n=1 Tax=Alistipes putredinis TaxID=28117 RepID=UPI003FD7F443